MTRTLRVFQFSMVMQKKKLKFLFMQKTLRCCCQARKKPYVLKAIGIFNKFRISSGLTLNLSKCEVLRIVSLRYSNAPFCSELNLRWANHNVSALGVVFSTNQNTVIKLNYELQLEKIQNVLNMGRERDLSLIGKTVILKALAISKLVFLFSSLPNPDENFFCRLKKIL